MINIRTFWRRIRGSAARSRVVEDERGSIAVEFALVAPVMFVVIFAVIDFSRAYYTLNGLTAAVREGARYAASVDDPVLRQDEIKNVVQYFAVTMGQDSLDDSQISVSFESPQQVRVEITDFAFQFVTPLPNMVGLEDIAITRAAVMKWERAPVP